MKSNRFIDRNVLAVTLLCMAWANAIAAADSTVAVAVAQQLVIPKSVKVEAILWTRRSDRYTLQVVLPRSRLAPAITPLRSSTEVTLWLLGADGAAILTKEKYGAGEIEYSVPLPAGEVAVAAALKIDGTYFIEALRPLK